jgi:hypothetical protein
LPIVREEFMQGPQPHIGVPNDVRKMLLSDEEVILAVKQTRWKALFTPDTLVVTNYRVIRYSPSGFLGLRRDIEDYRYEDMANFKISKGIMFATITIAHRFLSESLILDSMPKGRMNDVSRAVEERIRRARGGATATFASIPPQDAMEVLRIRFARGEITKEQFEEMKHTLE